LIKEKGKELKITYKLVLKIREEDITTHEWKYGIKSPIHKKGML